MSALCHDRCSAIYWFWELGRWVVYCKLLEEAFGLKALKNGVAINTCHFLNAALISFAHRKSRLADAMMVVEMHECVKF